MFAPPRTVVMVETVAAVANLADIVAVDGVAAVFVGPSDLALAHGLPVAAQDDGGPGSDRHAELVSGITAVCARAGVPVGIYCDSPAHVRRFRALGCTFTMLAAEQAILRAALAEKLADARS